MDPEYALAHFDLANLYDERGDRDKAVEHYQAALRIAPNYADAHYNLALLYQGSNQPMRAVRHWTNLSEAGSGEPLGEHRAKGTGEAARGGGGAGVAAGK